MIRKIFCTMNRTIAKAIGTVTVALLLLSPSFAAEPIAALNSRFQPKADGSIETTEIPDFQKHITPLLGRMGCNGRACHGSFQGQGGFMLSLFGYDFEADHKALLDDEAGRVDVKKSLESLILTKPVDADMHEGGQRFKEKSWEYWVLRKWIEAGAPTAGSAEKGNAQKLERLDVSPLEISFDAKGKASKLKAIAVWQDGTKEDVTTLCRFFSNDTAIAQIDETGKVTAGDSGDTHVVVAYDIAVVPVSILRPIGKSGQLKGQVASAKNEIDRLVLTKLDKLGIMPSSIVSDAEFFRRVSLDIAGTLPTSEQVRNFLADKSPNKRAKTIDALLVSPGYAAWWTTFLCDMTGNNDDQLRNFSPLPNQSSQHWYQWIYERVAKNVPYDEIVEGIVTAVSREPNESYLEYCENMSKISTDDSGKSFADRSDMMYYWVRQNQRTAEERAISFAYTFCGVRIQCAQCHKHPFDQWTKTDFDQFERLFDGVQANQNSYMPESKDEVDKIIKDLGLAKSLKGNELRKKLQEVVQSDAGKTIPFPEMYVRTTQSSAKGSKDKKASSAKKMPTARLLGSDYVDLGTVADPREPLMEWLRRKENPYFAKAIVNRVWSHYFQVGIVNPADDLNLANAPSNEALLNYLADSFVENGYDLKWLHRTILNTDTYQRSWETNKSNELDRRNFSHSLLRRLPAETAYDALRIALSNDAKAKLMCNLETDRAMTMAGSSARSNNGNRSGTSGYALSVFGRSIRESNCDCDKSSDPSLLQTVFIRNDSDVLTAMNDPKNGWLAQVAAQYKLSPSKDKEDRSNDDMQSKKAEREMEELDRKIRTYRKQVEIAEKSNNDKKIAEAKKNLASYEKRYKAVSMSLPQLTEQKSETKESSSEQMRSGLSKVDEAELIEETYLRTLSRSPSSNEFQIAQVAIEKAETPLSGISDLLWALINSKEFILNH
ncbi:MAG: DUF1549 domain-containing protein [Pirellulaceae bacterium]|nr:DUF1549 domain-containing protein [Pirellulaceae bacterium]